MFMTLVKLHFSFLGPLVSVRILNDWTNPIYGEVGLCHKSIFAPTEEIIKEIQQNYILFGVDEEWITARLLDGKDFYVDAIVKT